MFTCDTHAVTIFERVIVQRNSVKLEEHSKQGNELILVKSLWKSTHTLVLARLYVEQGVTNNPLANLFNPSL